jgi:outer membrane cobalamin receptor
MVTGRQQKQGKKEKMTRTSFYNSSENARRTTSIFTGMWMQIQNIFWSHASQRVEYRDFGDVITFDTTHKTNSKRMPLAMFVGANNNLKNVTFG